MVDQTDAVLGLPEYTRTVRHWSGLRPLPNDPVSSARLRCFAATAHDGGTHRSELALELSCRCGCIRRQFDWSGNGDGRPVSSASETSWTFTETALSTVFLSPFGESSSLNPTGSRNGATEMSSRRFHRALAGASSQPGWIAADRSILLPRRKSIAIIRGCLLQPGI